MGRMILNGTVYGAGSKVEANPSGTATDELKKIDIDGTIYDINKSYLVRNAFIYSTDETQVGVWTDGKPLYQKTWALSTPLRVGSDWTNTAIDSTDIDRIIECLTFHSDGTCYDEISADPTRNNHTLVGLRAPSNGLNVSYITLQYTKISDAAGSGGYQAYGFTPVIYSTEEREVGVWIDNKPLYQKTIVQNNLNWGNVNGVNSSIAHGVSNLDKCVGLKMSCPYLGVASGDIINNGNTGLPLASFRVNTTNVYCVGGNGFYSGSADRYWFITILYTKTTDAAGSGSYNTLGVPMVHYSTDEQVIGTWIDGKPLYEKTIEWTGSSNNNSIKIDSTIDSTTIKVRNLQGVGYMHDNVNEIPMPYCNLSANQSLSINVADGMWLYNQGINRIVKVYATVRYTKNAD